ncbi:Lysine-specific demethylase JMJ703 [Glycine soja]
MNSHETHLTENLVLGQSPYFDILVIMEADYGKDCTKSENRENLSVPPGFTSLTSFILKRDGNVTARWHPEDAIREVLEEAPTFHPTEEVPTTQQKMCTWKHSCEFKDTLKYIASIRSRAEPYGMCRIVPPTCWKPPCSLEKKNIWEKSEFVAQIQRIDGHQLQHAQEIMASACGNTKTKRKRDVKVALDSQLGNRNTSTPNNQNVQKCDCESEPGPKFSLKTLKKYADIFKSQYFDYKDKKKIIGSNIKLAIHQQWEPSVENIEGEYGRIVQNPTEEIKVLCVNTLEAGVFSSGFPTVSDPVEAYTYPEYLKSGWNLNNILSLSGSLLCFESSEASRNFAPKIHMGMCFSPLNWKVEEHHLYSLYYVHLGEPKVWYGIPGKFAINFETIWKKYLPDLQAGQPDMHHNMSRIQSESLKRKFLCTSLVSQRMDENFDATCKRECSICLRDLHLSAVGCSCSDNFACLDHAKQLCSCTWSNKTLFYRYEINNLNVLCQALDGKLSAVFKWAKEDLGLTLNSVASKRSKQSSKNISGSTHPSQDLQMNEPVSQTASDESSKGKQRQLLDILNSSKTKDNEVVPNSSKKKKNEVVPNSSKKQNAVVSQVVRTFGGTHSSSYDIRSKMKTTLLQSTFADDKKGINSVGAKIDTKTLGHKFTISKEVGDPKVSKVPSVTNARYLPFLQDNVLADVSSDSSSTSMSSDSEDEDVQVANG